MQVEVSRYERVAGLFVVIALVAVTLVSIMLVVRTGYFSEKTPYSVVVKSATGLHVGTRVQMSGLNVGWVDDVDLIAPGQVLVEFSILEEYARRVVEGTKIQMVRPYAVGEKLLEIQAADPANPPLPSGSSLPLLESFDLVDLMSGRTLGPFVASIEALVGDLNNTMLVLQEAGTFERVNALLDQSTPVMENVNNMSREMAAMAGTFNEQQRLAKLLREMQASAQEMNQLLPVMRQNMPAIMEPMPELLNNLNAVSQELQQLTPVLAEVGPELPRTSRRAIEAIDEAVILMKALQKSFLLEGKVEDVREEERQRRQRRRAEQLPAIEVQPNP
ncbi:ABC-type multidrug transport system substrate-binding protein, putative [gamma proteobacterium HTCC5015]|nr:ABC-type multidrug transport system substrate-binding protein, putative [gamma proteobacterium HTCC5015]